MSADTPASVHDSPARNDHARPAEADRARPAEQAPSRQQADAGRTHQPAQALNRADYNRARYDTPPIQGPGTSGHQQPDARARPDGDGGRRAEQVTPGRAAETAQSGAPRSEALNRAEYNQARHAEPPIRRPGSPESAKIDHTGSGPEGQAPASQRDSPHSWVSVVEGDRTVGDLTPTGIGLKPTGEQLTEAVSGERSRLEKLSRCVEDEDFINDLRDAGEENANTVEQFLAARHPQGHAIQGVPDSHHDPLPVQEHATAGDIVGAGLMTGLVLLEAGRRVHDVLAHRKEKVES